MKKFIVAVLALVMLLAIAASASAYEDHVLNIATFTLSVPCQAISDDQLYNYHARYYATEKAGDRTIYVKHRVSQIDADETNRIAAYSELTSMTMGAHWHPSDSGLYPCMSNAIERNKRYTAAGRGNTNYASKYGLNTITLDGTVDPDRD